MIPYEREKIILEALEQKEVVSIDGFFGLLDKVSESTIRRDLKNLEQEGKIVLLRGGAAKVKSASHDISLLSRNQINIKEKEKIARTAASLVQDGEVIYIDSGSTLLRMVKHLLDKKITIVTTNAMVFSEIADSKLQCMIIGGDILNATASIVGPLTDTTLQSLYFDKAFIGATGYYLESGINTPDAREANKKRIVANNTKKIYALLDTSKEGKRTMNKAIELNECTIIAEKETEFLKKYAKYIIAY